MVLLRWVPSQERQVWTTLCSTVFLTPGSSVETRHLLASSLTPSLSVKHSTCAVLVVTPLPSSVPMEPSSTSSTLSVTGGTTLTALINLPSITSTNCSMKNPKDQPARPCEYHLELPHKLFIFLSGSARTTELIPKKCY